MKKKLSLICVCITLLLCITGCGSSKTVSELDKPVEIKDWKITMKNIEYSEGYCKVLNYNFLTSNTTYKSGDTEFICSQEKAESGKKFLLFEMTVEYIGKSKSRQYITGFNLDYNNGYNVRPESVYISKNGENWEYIDGGAVNTKEVEIDSLDNPNFIIRGAFEINDKIETDTESSLIIKTPALFDFTYKIR